MKKLAVVHGEGSLSVFKIAEEARGLCEIVWVVDPDDLADGVPARLLKHTGTVVEVDAGDARECARRVGEASPDGIIVFADAQIPLATAIASELGLRFHDVVTSEALTNKLAQREALGRAGIDVPTWEGIFAGHGREEINRAARIVGFPAVLKPQEGAGSRATFLVASRSELEQHLEEIWRVKPDEDFIVESFFVGSGNGLEFGLADYVSVESIAFDGLVTHLALTSRFPLVESFRESGVVIPSSLGPGLAGEVLDLVSRSLAALGIMDGCSHTEVKLTPNGPRIIEVNGRMGGAIPEVLEIATGVSLVKLAVSACFGEAPGFQGLLKCERIAYEDLLQPPVEATRLEGLEGLAALEELEIVRSVLVNREVGGPVDWRMGTNSYVIAVFGAVDDHRRLIDARKTIRETVAVTYS